jgi:DNA primase
MDMPMDEGPPPMLPADDWPPPPDDAAGGYDTWTPPAESQAGSFSGAPGGRRRFFPGKGGAAAAAAAAARRGVPGRHLPSSRAGRAVQIVLTEPLAWERLSQDEHQLLCELAAPHGDLFRWIDSQHHDHGPQPWSALREALRGHALESFAVGEVGRVPPDIESDPKELESILALERQARDDAEMKRLVAAAATDPAAMEQYKALLAARKARAGS